MAESSHSKASIDGWTKDEKYSLMLGLKACGSGDISGIQDYISTKTPEQIEMAINHYKLIAAKHPLFEKKVIKPKNMAKSRVPLTSWAKLLTDHVPLEELKTETATAVRMIAELETMPAPASVENIDFRKIYHTIANAMEGKPLQTDKITAAVLNHCIVQTALSSKVFIKPSSYKNIVTSINMSDKEAYTCPLPTEDEELTVLRHLASQKSYNPLGVPEAFMKPTGDENLPDNENLPNNENLPDNENLSDNEN